jgi:hypothetical protein
VPPHLASKEGTPWLLSHLEVDALGDFRLRSHCARKLRGEHWTRGVIAAPDFRRRNVLHGKAQVLRVHRNFVLRFE